jgi:hypothetical protein
VSALTLGFETVPDVVQSLGNTAAVKVGVDATAGTVATTAFEPPLANVYVVVRVTLSAAQVTVLPVAVFVAVEEKPSPYVVTMVCVFPL